ncbi:MAG: polysaccharide deacetylase [Firmicutes bacterium]|nr:polysaccharide deacetylase [Bacillota bacterium]
MLNRSKFFNIIGIIFGLFILVAVLLPIVILPSKEALTNPPTRTAMAAQMGLDNNVSEPPPYVYYLSDIPIMPPPETAVYDPLTVSERKISELPLTLPQVLPYYGEKTVYLTFDDGPDADNTPAILDILEANNVKATFFVIGNQVEKNPDLLRRIFNAGHAIGNHSYSHIYKDLYQSVNTYTDQLEKTDESIKRVIGVRPRICRAPGGSSGTFNKEYWDSLTALGYKEFGWNIVSGDASFTKAGQLVANIKTQIKKNKFLYSHSIVLMHDGRGHSETVKALPEIINYFKSQGFEFRVINLETPPAW